MKKFFSVIVLAIIFLLAENCSAMTFSKSVKLGSVGQYGPYGVQISGATSIKSGSFNKEYKTYMQGSAIFGKSLNFYFDFQNDISKFGSNEANAISIYALEGATDIYQVQNDKNIEMYIFVTETGGGGSTKVVGQKDGKFFIYFDTNKVMQNYFGRARDVYLSHYKLQGDAIVFDITSYDANLKKTVKGGELRFKWDDKANWFSVEKL